MSSISYGNITIPFLLMQSPQGGIEDEPTTEAQVLETPGANGRRWRELFEQFEPFTIKTFSECTDYTVALLMKARAKSLKNKLVNIYVSIDGATYNYRQVHVSAVACTPHPGPMAGQGVGNGQAHLEIDWALELTDFDDVTDLNA